MTARVKPIKSYVMSLGMVHVLNTKRPSQSMPRYFGSAGQYGSGSTTGRQRFAKAVLAIKPVQLGASVIEYTPSRSDAKGKLARQHRSVRTFGTMKKGYVVSTNVNQRVKDYQFSTAHQALAKVHKFLAPALGIGRTATRKAAPKARKASGGTIRVKAHTKRVAGKTVRVKATTRKKSR